MKIIGLIGYSGSGKTYLITNAIRKLKKEYNLDSTVFKYIHEHEVDKKGKDTYKYIESGAQFSITRNAYNETAIILKKEISNDNLISWIKRAPLKTDILFFEGFRDLDIPMILCLREEKDLEKQMNNNIRAISGKIIANNKQKAISGYPLINIEKEKNEVYILKNIFQLEYPKAKK